MRTAYLLPVLLASSLFAQAVDDPFPAKIQVSETRVNLSEVAAGFDAPVWAIGSGDGSGRLFIVDQTGIIRILDKSGKLIEAPFLDATSLLVKLSPQFDERGLLGLAFHPGFSDPKSEGHRKLYTYTSEPAGEVDFPLPAGVASDHSNVVTEWKVSSDNPNQVDVKSRRVVLSMAHPAMNHDSGALLFGADGLLYIGVGDGGAGHDLGPGHAPEGNGQSLVTPLGKVLRIDPLGKSGQKARNGQYSIPSDNPNLGGHALPEIFTYGMRNPWRISLDVETGRMIAADVGQARIEEVDILTKGGNYGWPIKEGSFYFHRHGEKIGTITRETQQSNLPQMVEPVLQYDHDEGISITGGFVYRGKSLPALTGKYIFGDWTQFGGKVAGRLFVGDLSTGQIEELKLGKEGRSIEAYVIGFGQDEAGELYVLTTQKAGPQGKTGKVSKIAPLLQ